MLSPAQQERYTSICQLLGSQEREHIMQGMRLLEALQDPELWSLFSDEVVLSDAGELDLRPGEIMSHVAKKHRDDVTLWIARQCGMLDDCARLDLSKKTAIRDLQPLAGLPQLRLLSLAGCSRIQDFTALSTLTGLTHLDLSGHSETAPDLSVLVGMQQLRELNLTSRYTLSSLTALSTLTGLTHLNLSHCSAVTDIAPLAGLTRMVSLSLAGVKGITSLLPLAEMSALTQLDLRFSDCSSRDSFRVLGGLANLTHLNLGHWRNLKSVEQLEALSRLINLTHLNISYSRVRGVNPLRKCKKLIELDVTGGSCFSAAWKLKTKNPDLNLISG